MAQKNKHQGESLFKAVLITHFILFLHLVIIAAIVLIVIFFQWITQHILWVLLGAGVIFVLSAIIIFRRIKSKGKEVFHDIEKSSLYRGRDFEVSFLQGLVSLKFGQPGGPKAIGHRSSGANLQLEDPETIRIRELTELARMYEKNLITAEEYTRAKNQIMKSL